MKGGQLARLIQGNLIYAYPDWILLRSVRGHNHVRSGHVIGVRDGDFDGERLLLGAALAHFGGAEIDNSEGQRVTANRRRLVVLELAAVEHEPQLLFGAVAGPR